MIPFIRSLSELMAITDSRECQKHVSQYNESYSSTVDSGQRKRYIKSLKKKEVDLPDLPKTIRRKWMQNKISLSRFIDDLDYFLNFYFFCRHLYSVRRKILTPLSWGCINGSIHS